MKRSTVFAASLTAVAVSLLGGCTTYYKVVDPTSGKEYYTTDVDQTHGSTRLVDQRSGAKVTIQNSEVTTISSEEYKAATAKKK